MAVTVGVPISGIDLHCGFSFFDKIIMLIESLCTEAACMHPTKASFHWVETHIIVFSDGWYGELALLYPFQFRGILIQYALGKGNHNFLPNFAEDFVITIFFTGFAHQTGNLSKIIIKEIDVTVMADIYVPFGAPHSVIVSEIGDVVSCTRWLSNSG